MADSPPPYGGRSAVLLRGRPWSTSNASTSLPRHPPVDSPRHTRGQSASASPLRVMRAESGRHVSPRPHASATPPLPPEHPVLSLPHLIHSTHILSQAPSHGGAPPSSPPLKPLHLAGALPEDAGERRRLAAPPRSSSSSLGRSFPNEFFFHFIFSFKPQARRTTPSYSKPSPTT